jgi:hypothetical protein
VLRFGLELGFRLDLDGTSQACNDHLDRRLAICAGELELGGGIDSQR